MRDERAVSPVIGTLLILGIFTVVATSVIMVAHPQIVAYQERNEFHSVVGQMNQVMVDARQLAVSGNTHEVRHPTVQLPRGDLQLTEGHFVAVSVGYLDADINQVTGDATAVGEHPWLYVAPAAGQGPTWDGDDTRIRVYFNDTRLQLIGADMFTELSRWSGSQWTIIETNPKSTINHGDPFPTHDFQDTNGNLLTLRDGPWRIRAYVDPALGSDILVGETYIYDQTRLTYRYHGESGPRHAYGENGGVYVNEDNRYVVSRGSLFSAPHSGLGGSAMAVRAATLEAEDGDASGRTQVGFLMRVETLESWVHGGGAAVVQIQFSGDFPELLYTHMGDRGFHADADPAKGVFYADKRTNAGEHTAFAFHLFFSELDLRFRQT